MMTDEQRWKIEQIVNTCKGVCEVGKLLHLLWSAHKELENYIKTHEEEVWCEIQDKLKEEGEDDT